ncbi:MAG: hypothetical protein ABW189_04395 [Rickettsiales bacterium]
MAEIRKALRSLVAFAVFTGVVLASKNARAEAYSESINVVDRQNGPHMLAEELEFVAAASFTTLHVTYNIYMHNHLVENARLPDLDPKRILAEERMVSESRKMCDNHLRANECYVFLWTELANIPPGDKSFIPYGTAAANGIYRNLKGVPPSFSWRNNPGGIKEAAKISEKEPYKRDVKANNRFLTGARMMGEDLEFISAESLVRLTVIYHLYLHPKLMRDMQLRDLSTAHITAEKTLNEEAKKSCAQQKTADKCIVLFWGELSTIPLESKQETYERFMDKTSGYFTKIRDQEGEFVWK